MSKWEHKRAVFEDDYRKHFGGSNDLCNKLLATWNGDEYLSALPNKDWRVFCAALDHMEAEQKKLARSVLKMYGFKTTYGVPFLAPSFRIFESDAIEDCSDDETVVTVQLVEVKQS